MLYINNIKLTQFKNYNTAHFSFNKKVTGICGNNGIGKTNILDAIYYCCFTKSYFSKNEQNNVQLGCDGFRIEGVFEKNNKQNKTVAVYKNKKEFTVNDIAYDKIAEHIGLLTCVIISPDDIELITGSSEIRRKYIDTLICQIDKEYLYTLMNYNKILQQRNSLLKQIAESGTKEFTLLEIIDQQLCNAGKFIFEKRKAILKDLIPSIDLFYKYISNDKESVILSYESKLATCSFEELLMQSRQKDLALQRTTSGIHKDELSVQLNDMEFRTSASQGQKKSLLFAMKLAEFELLSSNKGYAPILLLDDVFEKLDDDRMNKLMEWVCLKNNGQVIITDTHKERLEGGIKKIITNYSIIDLNMYNG